MSGKIEVGCWAVMYKPQPCCGSRPRIFGIPFIVDELVDTWNQCSKCKKTRNVITAGGSAPGRHIGIDLLKRIDPPSESESQETKEELSV